MTVDAGGFQQSLCQSVALRFYYNVKLETADDNDEDDDMALGRVQKD